MDLGQVGITDRDSGCGSGFLPYSGRPKLSPKAKKGKSKEIVCLKSSLLGWKLLLKSDCSLKDFKKTYPVLQYIYVGLNKMVIKRTGLDPCQDPGWIRIQQQDGTDTDSAKCLDPDPKH
jgi:hypothetical protein